MTRPKEKAHTANAGFRKTQTENQGKHSADDDGAQAFAVWIINHCGSRVLFARYSNRAHAEQVAKHLITVGADCFIEAMP